MTPEQIEDAFDDWYFTDRGFDLVEDLAAQGYKWLYAGDGVPPGEHALIIDEFPAGTIVATKKLIKPAVWIKQGLVPIGPDTRNKALVSRILHHFENRSEPIELSDKRGQVAVVHPCARPGCKWQGSKFDDRGPYGHIEAQTKRRAVEELVDHGFRTIDIGALQRLVPSLVQNPPEEISNIEGLISDDPYVVSESFSELSVPLLSKMKESVRMHIIYACWSISENEYDGGNSGSRADEEAREVESMVDSAGMTRDVFDSEIPILREIGYDRELVMDDILAPSASRNPALSAGMSPSDFDPVSLARGARVEMEHTDDPRQAERIAMDHLVEHSDYYERLAKARLNPASLLPMVHSYLGEDYNGRLEYIRNMNLAALKQVMDIEEDDDLWIAAAEAKKELLRENPAPKKLSAKQMSALVLAAAKSWHGREHVRREVPNIREWGRVSSTGKYAKNTLRSLSKLGYLKHIGSGGGHGPSGLRDMFHVYQITEDGIAAVDPEAVDVEYHRLLSLRGNPSPDEDLLPSDYEENPSDSSMPEGFEGFEGFDVDYETPLKKTGHDCGQLLSALRRDDVVQVGSTRWKVTHARGVSVHVIKHGTRGRKLYKLVTVSLDPCEIEVQETYPGSGDIMHGVPPLARGTATGDPLVWARGNPPYSGYEDAKAQRDALEEEMSLATAEIKSFPRGAMNLVPDHVKASPEYRSAKLRTDRAFAKLRAFNAEFVKRFKEEIRADRSSRHRRNPPYSGYDKKYFDRKHPDDPTRESYKRKRDALNVFLDHNGRVIDEVFNGLTSGHPDSYDNINHRFDLKGKRKVDNFAKALWWSMPVGSPYYLEDINVDMLNDTPAMEANYNGQLLTIPDYAEESRLIAEQMAYYEDKYGDIFPEHEEDVVPF